MAIPTSADEKEQSAGVNNGAPPPPAELAKDLKSPGVARVQAISETLTLTDRIIIFCSVFLIAYVYGLDGTLRYTYQPYALSDFGAHSLSSTVNVVRSVISAAAQPTSAKIADVFGRVELLSLSVFFYVLGTIIEAVSHNVGTYAAGGVIYQIGYTMVLLLIEVIVADITSTKARLFFAYIPSLPFIINTWVSGNIAEAVLSATTWRWGTGMWCIIYTVCALPLILSLAWVGHRAKREGKMDSYKSSFEVLGFWHFVKELFWMLDVIGIILVIALLALILVPLTTAGGFQDSWKQAHVIVPLVIGVCTIPVFVFWQLRAPRPLIPFTLMKDRSVWGPLIIAVCFNFAFAMQSDFLYTVLVVAFGFGIEKATRVQSLYSFVSCIVGPIIGLVVFKVRRLKPFIMFGTALYMVAFGLLIHFRGDPSGAGSAGVIGAQVLLGIAGGCFPYPTLASLQVHLKHENLAVMTGVYLAMYNVGSALGNTVSGAIWTQVLPGTLQDNLEQFHNATLATAAFGDPFNIVIEYPLGTPERTAIVASYQHIQKLLTITGICVCVPLIALTFVLRNPLLNNEQNLAKSIDSDTETELDAAERRETA